MKTKNGGKEMKKMMILMVIVAGFGFMSCESPVTSDPATVQSVEIKYDGSPVYTRTTTLPVEITWSDGYVESDSVTVEGPADGPGIVPITYDAVGASSTAASTNVEFEDWRLVGTWKHESLDYTVTFNNDRSYHDSLGTAGN